MRKILDAHLHLWDPSERTHDWLEEVPILRRRFGPEDIDGGRYDLAGAVFVQADCRDEEALGEVRWVNEVARPLVRGVVAYAPVHLGAAAEPQLAALADEPLVADHFVECSRAHPGGERLAFGRRDEGGLLPSRETCRCAVDAPSCHQSILQAGWLGGTCQTPGHAPGAGVRTRSNRASAAPRRPPAFCSIPLSW
jgi:hypothetical protein